MFAVWRTYFQKRNALLHYVKERKVKKLSLLAMLTVLIGSALFVTSCGSKIKADTVWQMTKGAGGGVY